MNNGFEIADSIVAFIKGEATPQQIEILDDWLEEAEGNKRLLVSLLEDPAFDQRIREQNAIRVEDAFERVWARRQLKVRYIRLWGICAVASVVLLFLIGGMWMYRDTTPGAEFFAGQDSIITGKREALLTLASGEKVSLGKQDTLLCKDMMNIRVQEQGHVSYETADSVTPWNVEYNTMETPRGAEFQLTLSDGTGVWLNASSKLVYPVNFGGKERRVKLSGEAYFDVTHNDTLPFVVESSRSDVTVLGTEFCVRDYEGEANLTTLVRGRVSVKDPQGISYVIEPGQQVDINKEGASVRDVETIYFTSWKDGYFIFDQAPLGEIMSELSKWYDFECFFQNAGVASLRLTARLKKYDDISVILDILSETGEVQFSQKGKTVIVKSDGI